MKIKIIDMDHLGNGIGKLNNKVVFIPKTITGDICDIDIYKSYKKYDKGKVNRIIENSNLRIDSLCPYYQICGGCNISNLDYSNQLEFKVNKVKNIFKKYLDTSINPNVIGSKKEYQYRNKITYHNDNNIGLISEYENIVDIDNCLVDEKEPFQDIYFFKKTICTFQSKLRSVNKPAFLSFVLAHVKFLYIIIPENKARVIFSMMNGNKAIMRQEELIKAELLRCSSVNTELILDAENNAIRNRFAREWDKWLYWWNTPEVKEFYHTDYQLGWLLPLIENKEDISFDRFKAICLKNGDVKEAKGVFRRMRLLQKSIEDAYNDPISYNLIGTVLCLRGKKEQFQFLKWYFAIVGTEDHRVVSKELQRYFDWSILGATHQEIIDNNIDQYANRRKDFLHQLVSNDLYRSAYNTGAVWLLRCNVMQDCALNEGKGRKFSFDIWKNRSLEHIYPKSKVKHFQNGITLDWNDNPIDSSKLSDYKLDREDICLEIPSPVDNEEPTLYRASEHSIGNLVLLYKRNNSSFNARDFEEKKQIFFTIQDDEGFQSRHLIHTVSVFAHSKWEGKDIAKQKKTEIEHFESEYKEDYYE